MAISRQSLRELGVAARPFDSPSVCLALVFLTVAFLAAPAYSAPVEEAVRWVDTLPTAASDGQGLQYYLDSLGYDIDVANDESGLETFDIQPGLYSATLLLEVSSSASSAHCGIYPADGQGVRQLIFLESHEPGDSVSFEVSVSGSYGFLMAPRLPQTAYTWYSETARNVDQFDHALVFAAGPPNA